ncbi:MAG: oxygen-independent coproporphyrinogen III oxidase [Bdellovibrionales bacterium]|nr:oxygen-independent coproporphyrinogen III oxidase [Bdellovibrionales bacterium]
MRDELFYKYDVPAPRYTSYPTVPYWEDSPTTEEWVDSLNRGFSANPPWACYVHIPFCETLCTYCGCNTSITRNHDREMPYIELLLKEMKAYQERIQGIDASPLQELHLGGGTPTFLSPKNLAYLVSSIMKGKTIAENFLGSIEVDPRRTTTEHLQVLRDLGFSRVSLGVQDFDAEVQRLVHRIQPFEMTKSMTEVARDMGYSSVNFDLIYGLPTQTEESILSMMEKTWLIKPDRIALYSLAIVPWIKPAQKLFKDEDLPRGKEKRRLYEIARQFLIDKGYIEIGMDHFALPTDTLAISDQQGELHRNFMGYVEHRTQILLGLGVSAISETPDCFHQNEKALPVYERRVAKGEIPTLRGHKLTVEDQVRREQILQFMTKGETRLEDEKQALKVKEFLSEMIDDQLVEVESGLLKLTKKGKPFLRNACMALDERLLRNKPNSEVFSKSL